MYPVSTAKNAIWRGMKFLFLVSILARGVGLFSLENRLELGEDEGKWHLRALLGSGL
jgi:hypothetical protein